MNLNKKWLILISVGMGIFLATIDGSIVNVALPTLVSELKTDFPTIQWIVLVYLLTVTTSMLSVGRLGDMLGKKPIYTFGFAIFTIGSLLCGLSSSVYMLILFRFLQAIGAAMIMALGTAIVTEAFPASERGKALGITGAIVSVGIVIGPTLGGLILGVLSWNWIFFVNLPIGIIGIILVIRYIPTTSRIKGQRFDFWGAFVLCFGLLSLLVSLTILQMQGFSIPIVPLLFTLAIIFIIIFILIELRNPQPMVDLHLFRNQLFSINLITGLITFIAISGTTLLMPFYLGNVLGFQPQKIGLLMAIVPLATGVIAPISGYLSDRFGTRPITVLGLLILTIGYAIISTLNEQTDAIKYLLSFLPIGLGMGVFQSPNNSAIMGSAPRGRLGIVSGMLAVNRTLGQTTGIAILGAIWSWRVTASVGVKLSQGATSADPSAQVIGLQETLIIVVGVVFVAFILGVWALLQERKVHQ